MEIKALVSVLMTAYNRENYIAEAIESVLASKYKNFELIIVDDGSKDKTVLIAKSFEKIDPRIKVHVNEVNLGDYCNRNKAASLAKGTYLLYVDSDDTIYPDTLEYCINKMEYFPEADIAMYYPIKSPKQYLYNPKESIQKHFFEKPFLVIGPGGTFLKKEFFLRLGMYPTAYGPANDMYFNILAASRGNILLLDHEFMMYRIHEGQEANNKYSYLVNNYRYLRDALLQINLPLSKQQKEFLSKKNKRRFVVEVFKFFSRSFAFKKTFTAIRRAEFSFNDALIGIFHI